MSVKCIDNHWYTQRKVHKSGLKGKSLDEFIAHEESPVTSLNFFHAQFILSLSLTKNFHFNDTTKSHMGICINLLCDNIWSSVQKSVFFWD